MGVSHSRILLIVVFATGCAPTKRQRSGDPSRPAVVSLPSAVVPPRKSAPPPRSHPALAANATKEEALRRANDAYEAGDRETAKRFYLQAAGKGSAEAHFALGYKYALPGKQGLHHFIEAAKQGHGEALDYALEGLLFRAASLKDAHPERALRLYETAKIANPELTLYDEDGKAQTLRMCAEPKGFDTDAFIAKYGIRDNDRGFGYGVWELAEEASTGGQFGKPDPWLVLNLICHGSSVPMELEIAVVEAHANWKRGVAKKFDLCMVITSGFGQGYCARREAKKAATKRAAAEKALIASWPSHDRSAFEELKKAADRYFNAVVKHEVDLSGTARAAFQAQTEVELRDAFQQSLARFENGDLPAFSATESRSADVKMKKLYSRIMSTTDLQRGTITPEGIAQVQREWQQYRDAWIKLGSIRYPRVRKDAWRTWLTQERIAHLEDF